MISYITHMLMVRTLRALFSFEPLGAGGVRRYARGSYSRDVFPITPRLVSTELGSTQLVSTHKSKLAFMNYHHYRIGAQARGWGTTAEKSSN